jgi:Cu+-exporting ATPase
LAGTGVLLKGGAALERLARVSALALDKTGTVTEGRLHLGEIVPLAGVEVNDLLRLAATAERRSEHVLAQLILQAARNRQLDLAEVQDFQAHPGAGVVAATPLGTIVVGNRRLLEEQGITLGADVEQVLQRLDIGGQTALLVARNGAILGVIGAHDQLRPGAAEVLQELRQMGIAHIALLTGDRAAVAQTIAAELGITDVHAELLPAQKAEMIERMKGKDRGSKSHPRSSILDPRSSTRAVAMVGDGINDAPALAAADVGLAVGSGTDIAAEAGDVVLMGDPLRPLPLLVRLSRATVKIIYQNILIFAFGVNFIGIVLTAWLWPLLLPEEWWEQAPIAAVIYHQLGSLAVLLNSMRLLWFERAATNPLLARTRRGFERVDHFLEHHLDVGEAIHWLEHHWKPALAAALFLLLAGYAATGLTQINADEVAVVCRFGRPVADLEPGFSWRWPWPMEQVYRLRPDQIRTIEVGFRTVPGATSAQAVSWVSSHGGDGLRRVPEEAVMMTGDGELVDVQATVRYRVVNAYVYLFGVREPEEIIRGTTEAILRGLAARKSFGSLLTRGRAEFQKEALTLLKERLATYGDEGRGLGVHIEGLSLQDLHPPQEVVESYYKVTREMQNYETQVNNAEGEAAREKARAEAESLKIVREATAAYQEKVKQAQAYREGFEIFGEARRLNLAQEWDFFAGAVDDVLGGMSPDKAERKYQEARQVRIAQQQSLTDFRLFWEALASALKGRSLVLIDSPKVPGRHHLLLLDPDQLRLPIVLPNRNLPPPKGRQEEGP